MQHRHKHIEFPAELIDNSPRWHIKADGMVSLQDMANRHTTPQTRAKTRELGKMTQTTLMRPDTLHHMVSQMPHNYSSQEQLHRMVGTCKCFRQIAGTELASSKWTQLERGRKFISTLRRMLFVNGFEINNMHDDGGRNVSLTAADFSVIVQNIRDARNHTQLVLDIFSILCQFFPSNGRDSGDEFVLRHPEQIKIYTHQGDLCRSVMEATESVLARDVKHTDGAPDETSTDVAIYAIRILGAVCLLEYYRADPYPAHAADLLTCSRFVVHIMDVFSENCRYLNNDVMIYALRSLTFTHTTTVFTSSIIVNPSHNVFRVMAELMRLEDAEMPASDQFMCKRIKLRAFHAVHAYLYVDPDIPNPDDPEDYEWPKDFRRLLKPASDAELAQDPDLDLHMMWTCKYAVRTVCEAAILSVSRRQTLHVFSQAMQLLTQLVADIARIRQVDTGPFKEDIAHAIHTASNPKRAGSRMTSVTEMGVSEREEAFQTLLAIYDQSLGPRARTLVFDAAINILDHDGCNMRDVRHGVQLLANITDIACRRERHALIEQCTFVEYEDTVDGVATICRLESTLARVFRVANACGPSSYTPAFDHYLMRLIEAITRRTHSTHTAHSAHSAHILKTGPDSPSAQPILFELTRILHTYRDMLMFTDSTQTRHRRMYRPMLLVLESITAAFEPITCDAADQHLASASPDPGVYFSLIAVVARILVLDSLSCGISTEVVVLCCTLLCHTLRVTHATFMSSRVTMIACAQQSLHTQNCTQLRPSDIHNALGAISRHGINTQHANLTVFNDTLDKLVKLQTESPDPTALSAPPPPHRAGPSGSG